MHFAGSRSIDALEISIAWFFFSPQYLCSRKELDSLIKGKRDLSILSGWKNELIGNYLVQFLAGKAQLSYTSGELSLNTEVSLNNNDKIGE